MLDVMWARPDGRRVLLAPRPDVADFVTSVYGFDEVVVTPLTGGSAGRETRVDAPDLTLGLVLTAGPGWRLPFGARRPAWFHRWAEGPVARAVMGVRTYGVSPTGVHEWYRADAWRPLVSARATLGGEDLGAMAAVDPPCRFGFSEPPRRPSMVAVRPLLGFPPGPVLLG